MQIQSGVLRILLHSRVSHNNTEIKTKIENEISLSNV